RARVLGLRRALRLEARGLSGGALRLRANRVASALPGPLRRRPGRRDRGGPGGPGGVRPMKVSVVVPVYNEEGNLPALLRRLTAVMDQRAAPYELILVNDGSRDGSLAILQEWAGRRADRIRVLDLSHNVGQHQAILAGFRDVTGDVAVTLDADLQNPPEEIPKPLAKIEEGYDVVGGVRQGRRDPFFRRAASLAVNRMTVAITRMRLTDFGCMLRAYGREVVDEINACDEASTFLPPLPQGFPRRPPHLHAPPPPPT